MITCNPTSCKNIATFPDVIPEFLYREYRPKEDIEFLENGTEVSAVNPKTYVFEPDKSVGNPEVDLIRTINIPIVVSFMMSL